MYTLAVVFLNRIRRGEGIPGPRLPQHLPDQAFDLRARGVCRTPDNADEHEQGDRYYPEQRQPCTQRAQETQQGCEGE